MLLATQQMSLQFAFSLKGRFKRNIFRFCSGMEKNCQFREKDLHLFFDLNVIILLTDVNIDPHLRLNIRP